MKIINSSFSGKFAFAIPARVTYSNYQGKKLQYWKSVSRNLEVKSNEPIIKRNPKAHSNYYGRGKRFVITWLARRGIHLQQTFNKKFRIFPVIALVELNML